VWTLQDSVHSSVQQQRAAAACSSGTKGQQLHRPTAGRPKYAEDELVLTAMKPTKDSNNALLAPPAVLSSIQCHSLSRAVPGDMRSPCPSFMRS
jgi:hypothetical protein